MRICRRILAGFTILISLAMLVLSLLGGAGVWVVRQPAIDKATRVFGRINAALDLADRSLQETKASLDRAAERLESTREEQRSAAQDPQRASAMRRMMARTVQQRIAPELGNANEKLHTVAEAAVVVNSILEDVGNIPLLSVSGLDMDRLRDMNSRLTDVGPAAWELSRLLGESTQEDADAASEAMTRIEQTLDSMRGWVADLATRLAEVRQRVDELESRTLAWITPAVIIISVVCFWIALSQVSLIVHAWSWWKRA